MNTAQYSVGASPVLVFSGTGRLKVRQESGLVVIGNSAVTVSNGLKVTGTETFEFSCPTDVYAVSNGSFGTVHVASYY